MEGLGLLQRAQLLALDVLHQGQLEQAVVRDSRTTMGTVASPACWAARQRRSPAMIW
jgi:hypothetical protein